MGDPTATHGERPLQALTDNDTTALQDKREYVRRVPDINEVKNGDSTEIKVEKERILRNKKGYLVQTAIKGGACNYYFEPSSNKAEKKAGIYDITLEIVMNNGSRKDLFFRGIKTEEKKGKKK